MYTCCDAVDRQIRQEHKKDLNNLYFAVHTNYYCSALSSSRTCMYTCCDAVDRQIRQEHKKDLNNLYFAVHTNYYCSALSSSLFLSVFPDPSLTPENLSTVLDSMQDGLWNLFSHYVNIPTFSSYTPRRWAGNQ